MSVEERAAYARLLLGLMGAFLALGYAAEAIKALHREIYNNGHSHGYAAAVEDGRTDPVDPIPSPTKTVNEHVF